MGIKIEQPVVYIFRRLSKVQSAQMIYFVRKAETYEVAEHDILTKTGMSADKLSYCGRVTEFIVSSYLHHLRLDGLAFTVIEVIVNSKNQMKGDKSDQKDSE